MLDAHPLDKHLTLGLVLFVENAFCSRFLQNSYLRNLPTAPVIKFAVIANDRRTFFSMCPPYAALPFRPDVPDQENESVDEAELCRERKVRLKLFSCALRNEAEPSRERLSANFPRKAPEQHLADGPRIIVRFATHRKTESSAGFLVPLEFFD